MKKLASFTLACLTFAALAPITNTYAGNRPGALSFTLGGGYVYLNSKRNMQDRAAGLVAMGYDLTEHWGVEGMFAAFNTKFDKDINDRRKISGSLFSVGGVYHFMPDSVIEPYISAGVGIIGLNPNRFDANNEGNINAALGTQIFATRSVVFQLEARDYYTWVGGKNDAMLSGGISFLADMC